jgi:chromosome segregation ATPase
MRTTHRGAALARGDTTSAVGGPNHTSSSNVAAMNLWEKFSDMQRSIESSRQERDTLQQGLDACKEKQQVLQQNRRDEQQRCRAAEQQAAAFDQKVADMEYEYQTNAQPDFTAASLAKENVDVQRDRWKEYKTTEHQAFLDESHEFQSTCKRLRIKATMLGLNHAGIQAAAYARSGGDPTEAVVYDGLDDDDDDDALMATHTLDDSSKDDPSKWYMPLNDFEFQELFTDYLQKKSQYESARDDLERSNARKHDCEEKESSRSHRTQMLQTQLDRISKDEMDLESQIHDLKQLTEEAKCMAASFSQG